MTQYYPAPGGYPSGPPGPPGYPGYPPPGPPTGQPYGAMPTPPREKRQFSMWAGYVLFLSPRLWRGAGQRGGGGGVWVSGGPPLGTGGAPVVQMAARDSAVPPHDPPHLTSPTPPGPTTKREGSA